MLCEYLTYPARKNNSSLTSSSAVSIGLYLPTLCAQTGVSGMLAGGNCPPGVEQLEVYELFRVLLNAIKRIFLIVRNHCKSAAATL